MELEFGDPSFSWRSPVHWGGFPEEAPGLPSHSPLSQGAVFHHAEFCLPGAAPMGWGHRPALSLNSDIMLCKEARNTGFLDDLGFNFVFIA